MLQNIDKIKPDEIEENFHLSLDTFNSYSIGFKTFGQIKSYPSDPKADKSSLERNAEDPLYQKLEFSTNYKKYMKEELKLTVKFRKNKKVLTRITLRATEDDPI